MADFTININAEPVIPFQPNGSKFRQIPCTAGEQDIPLGVIEATNTPANYYLLTDYTGANNYKTLIIKNLQMPDDPAFYMEYNGVKLVPNVDPNVAVLTVNITGIAADAVIPLFNLVYNNDLVTATSAITYDIEIIDVTDASLGTKPGLIYLTYVECPPTIVKEKVVVDSSTNNSCYTEEVVTVKVPTGSSRYVYGVISDGFGSITGGTLPETITADKQYTLKIDAANGTSMDSFYSVVQIFVKDSVSDGTINAHRTISRNHSGNIC